MADFKLNYTGAQINTLLGKVNDISSFTGTQINTILENSLLKTEAQNTYQPIITNGTTGQFYRGDKTWSDTLTSNLTISGELTLGSLASGTIHISGAASNNMAYNTSNPRIKFSENNVQAVGIVYTDYDSYRATKGLRVQDLDNLDTGNVWLEAQGQMYAKGFNNTSSRTVKHNINNIKEMGNILDQLSPVTFEYNDIPGQLRYGLIFEDTINILPTICEESGESKTINYVDLVPILLKEIQSLRKRIKALEENK